MKFEWNESKNQTNKKKHGISFTEAVSIFHDPFILSKYDEAHSSDDEDRWNSIGETSASSVLMVVHLAHEDDRFRIISARKATNNEKKMYYYRREQMI